MLIPSATQGLVVIGAGPAGLAPLFAAASAGRLHELLRLGITVLERSDQAGNGSLGMHGITSDSSADAFLDIVTRSQEPRLLALRAHPATQALLQLGKQAAPLKLVSDFLAVAGAALCALIAESSRGRVITGADAVSVTRTQTSGWRTQFRSVSDGAEYAIDSRFVVLATGAHQARERLLQEHVGGSALFPRYKDTLLQSGEVLATGGASRVQERLHGLQEPKVIVVGGSTSAGSVADDLLRDGQVPALANGRITILHRRPLRIFYETVEEAQADEYDEFRPQDVCSRTGRVYRFSGFRLRSRELIMRARGIGNRSPEPRLQLLQLRPENALEVLHLLDNADLIVAALGYTPKLLPVLDREGRRLPIGVPGKGAWSVVDRRCRLLSEGEPLEGLFAIGLAVGPVPDETLGGEVGFRGQVNSLWMWQHVLGLRIVDEIRSQNLTSPTVRPVSVRRLPELPHSPPLGLFGAASARASMGE